MYALAMKWREGSEDAIKGMVMPMEKRMGTCRASGIMGCRGETEQLKRMSFGKGVWRRRRRYLYSYLALQL